MLQQPLAAITDKQGFS